jgi:hypothetical protein
MQRKSFGKMPCWTARGLERVGEWWSLAIRRDALHGMTRFDEFQKSPGTAPSDGFAPGDLVVSNAGNNQRIDFRELTTQQFENFSMYSTGAASRLRRRSWASLKEKLRSLPAAIAALALRRRGSL